MFLVTLLDWSLQFLFPLPLRFLALTILGLVLFATLNIRWMWVRWGVDVPGLLQIMTITNRSDSSGESAASADSNNSEVVGYAEAILGLVWGLCFVYGLAWCLVRLFGPASPLSILATWTLLLLFMLMGRSGSNTTTTTTGNSSNLNNSSKAPEHHHQQGVDPWILRCSFVGALGRIFASTVVWRRPVRATPLADVVLADVLTSFAKVLADWDVLLWCHLLVPMRSLTGVFPSSTTPPPPGLDDVQQLLSSSLPQHLSPIMPFPSGKCLPSLFSVGLVCFPYFFRFRQCLNDYFAGVLRQPRHLVNALKYLTSFPIIYLSYLMLFPKNTTVYRGVWLTCLCVNWVFSSFWDYFVDWDLGYASPGRIGVQGLASPGFPWLLRPHLLFPPWTYYLVAIANVLMRATWMVRVYAATIYPEDHPLLRLLESSSGVLLVQAVEVIRRFMWMVLRMEAHHTQQRTNTEYSKILHHHHHHNVTRD